MATAKSTNECALVQSWVIYVLRCPDTKAVRYVGWTINLKKRMYEHRYQAKKFNRHRDCWIRKLLRDGKSPEEEIVESGNGDAWATAEKKWIAHFRAMGCDLTNLTDGGEGVPGLKHSAENIEKNRLAKLGKKQSAETIAKRMAGMRGHVVTEATRAKISAANKGKIRSAEARKRCSDARKGKPGHPVSVEARRKIGLATSARLRGKKRGPTSEETKRKIGAANKGKLLGRRRGWKSATRELLFD